MEDLKKKEPKLEVLTVTDIPPNSFLIIRVDVAGPMEKYEAAKNIAQGLKSYQKIFREKNITIMVMIPSEGLEVLTESEMNQAGWYRKKS